MKGKTILISVFILLILTVSSVISQPQSLTGNKKPKEKMTKRKSKLATRGGTYASLAPPGYKTSPIPLEKEPAIISVYNIKFPKKALGSGPARIILPGNLKPYYPPGSTFPQDTVVFEYPNGLHVRREYRDPGDVTARNFKEYVEDNKKTPTPDGRTWQLVYINGYEGMAIEKGVNIWLGGYREPIGAVVSWYIEPYLYMVRGPIEVPLAKIIPFAHQLTSMVAPSSPKPKPVANEVETTDSTETTTSNQLPNDN